VASVFGISVFRLPEAALVGVPLAENLTSPLYHTESARALKHQHLLNIV
jgi:hypothetical protein